MNYVTLFVVYVILFHLEDSTQVSFTCDEEHRAGMKGDAGAPGKRGPEGPAGSPGPVGPKGDTDDVTAVSDDVRRLNDTVAELRRKLSLQPKIFHFRLPSNRFTWAIGKTFCEDLGMVLCSKDEIFPFADQATVPYGIGILSGDTYAPIRDQVNDWVQLADGNILLGPGGRHNGRYDVPTWGRDFSLPHLKGNLFCCLQESA